jgi:surface polysaccharide O-acyltransferase-like enzyme
MDKVKCFKVPILLRCTQISQQTPNSAGKIPIDVDLIRTIAIIGVILLHAANDLTLQASMNQLEVMRWWTVDVYQSLGRVGVPLFVMLTGALLLQPSKNESMTAFFKKRWARIGIPFIFWAVIYFTWDFFVNQQALTPSFVIQGVLTGPYFHFWYIYMLAGLYLLTPILRILIANASQKILRYTAVLWFLGAAILPLAKLLTPYNFDNNVLLIVGYVGYYVIGIYLLGVKIRRSTLLGLMSLGFALTVVGTYFIAGSVGGGQTYFFQEYLSPTMVLASVMLFLLLLSYKAPPSCEAHIGHTGIQKFMHLVSENTLPLFLFHMIIIECFQKGYFGVAINGNTVNSIVGVPLVTALTFFVSLAIIVPLKKVPGLRALLG